MLSRHHFLLTRPLSIFVLTLILCVHLPASSQPERSLKIERLTGKLWRVIEVIHVYTPQFQAHAILEAPDRDRLTLTFRTGSTQIFVLDDVLAFTLKTQPSGAFSPEQWEDYLTAQPVKFGKTRWWKERIKHEGEAMKREFRFFLEQLTREEKKI